MTQLAELYLPIRAWCIGPSFPSPDGVRTYPDPSCKLVVGLVNVFPKSFYLAWFHAFNLSHLRTSCQAPYSQVGGQAQVAKTLVRSWRFRRFPPETAYQPAFPKCLLPSRAVHPARLTSIPLWNPRGTRYRHNRQFALLLLYGLLFKTLFAVEGVSLDSTVWLVPNGIPRRRGWRRLDLGAKINPLVLSAILCSHPTPLSAQDCGVDPEGYNQGVAAYVGSRNDTLIAPHTLRGFWRILSVKQSPCRTVGTGLPSSSGISRTHIYLATFCLLSSCLPAQALVGYSMCSKLDLF